MNKFILALVWTIIIILFPIGVLTAQNWDCDGDGHLNVSDAVHIINYFYGDGGSVVNFYDCDCDGMPGITIGDAQQIISYTFSGGNLYPATQGDYLAATDAKITFTQFPLRHGNNFVVDIFAEIPCGLIYYVIPFSFKAEDNQMVLRHDSTAYFISNPDKSAFLPDKDVLESEDIILIGGSKGIPAGGAHGLLAKAYFTQVSSGTSNDIRPTSTDRGLYPLLIKNIYGGINGESKLLPMISPIVPGDSNCDGRITIGDVVGIINYLYNGGPAPGDCY